MMQLARYPHLRLAATGVAFFALAAITFTTQLRADEEGQPAQAVRLGYVDGRVKLADAGQTIADPALLNTPLFEGTQMSTTADGRAELQFDDGSVARLAPDGVLTIAVLRTAGPAQLLLERGLGYFEMQNTAASNGITVRFGDTTATASGAAVFRVRLDAPPGEVAVFSGNVHLVRGGLVLDLHGGESVQLAESDANRYTLAESIEPDSWDTWNADRDQALSEAAANRTNAASGYSSAGAPAWGDLESYGTWYNMPGQGNVWSPYEGNDEGWDPWGNGHWVWAPRFGYIWVSGDAWGYMPFACGMWSFYDGLGWGWMPGSCRPWWYGGYWSPTYVGYGGGPRGFRPPRRPPLAPPGGRGLLHPPIAVRHRPVSGPVAGGPRPPRLPVEIGGTTLQPLRPLPQRPQYDHVIGGPVQAPPVWGSYRAPTQGGSAYRPSGPQPGVPASGIRSGYGPPQQPTQGGWRTIFGGGTKPGVSGSSHTGQGGGPVGTPGGGTRGGAPSGGAHPGASSGGASHPSGGGGGGGSHPSSGGGGGGGGSHSSSSGGGGHH